MSVTLGSGWATPLEPVWDVPDPTDDMLAKVLIAVEALQSTFAAMPAPVVNLEPQDFTDIVTAVQDLKGPNGPTASEIAQAVRDALTGVMPAVAAQDTMMPALLAALEKLDFRMKGVSGSGGGGSLSPDITDRASRLLGTVTVGVAAGVFGYAAGTSGTVTLTGGKRVRNISAHCTIAGTVTINGGAAIPVPANSQFSASYDDTRLVNPVIAFTGTDSYYIDFLS